MPPPAGRPPSCLVCVGVAPSEAYWLELPDEAAAYQLVDRLSALGEEAARHFGSDGASSKLARLS